MSVDFDGWLGSGSSPVTAQVRLRAAAAWRRIQDNPTSVVFKTATGTTLAAQVVRLENDNPATEAESAAGLGAVRKLTIFGVRDHPTVADSDIKKGYRFVLGGKEYTVLDPILTHGEIQARAEAVS